MPSPDTIRASILSHRPDPAYMEDLWAEVERALGQEGGLAVTLDELVQRAADARSRISQ